ncbi:outer membrane lipoprotein carrier protein LolA [Falsihalocynthiibacter sp. SS001]|uniref:LolA family protein n=1 Tax=Falsihalocynthiibacter sp. SS001 TaxID=3349698 RepID=UPI0036D383DD
MKHLRLLLVPVLATFLALPAAAEKLSLNTLSNYFNSFETAQSRFTQINADGSKSAGTLYMRRPGRARFEYDPPNEALVIAGGGQVAIFDQKSNAGPEQYPLSRTPLSIILAKRVNLAQARMVTGHGTRGTDTVVRARDPQKPEYGSIDLIFAANPTRLIEWIINDPSGSKTRVILSNFKTGGNMPASLFDITLAANRR